MSVGSNSALLIREPRAAALALEFPCRGLLYCPQNLENGMDRRPEASVGVFCLIK